MYCRKSASSSSKRSRNPYLIVLQIRLRIRAVIARAVGHVAALERVVAENLARILPVDRLGATDTFRGPGG